MSARRVILLLALAWLPAPAVALGQSTEEHSVEVIGPPKIKPSATEMKPGLAAAVKIILDRTNEFRKAQGKQKVESNDKLTRTAEYFAGYMAKLDRYGHTADGRRPSDRAKKHGYSYCIIEENIAYEYNSAGFTTEELGKGFFEGWKLSPPHRRNMLDADVVDTGVAIARSEKTGYYYAVQMFGRPHSRAIEFAVANESDARIAYRIGERTFPLGPNYTRTHTLCRPAKVTFRLSGQAKTVEPRSGDRYVITNDSKGLHVKKQ